MVISPQEKKSGRPFGNSEGLELMSFMEDAGYLMRDFLALASLGATIAGEEEVRI